jgi:3-keto-disaccharide hydrolase
MNRMLRLGIVVGLLGVLAGCATQDAAKSGDEGEKKPLIQYVDTPTGRWQVHDLDRPAPAMVTPGEACGGAAADAVALFDGTEASMANWSDNKGVASKWVCGNGYMESVKGAGYIQTRQKFGSCQLHVEFATPATVKGDGQGRGNSGVFLQGQYEVQVLDSYNNKTYPDGQCSALYGRAVPLINACRKPGQWQSYDIIYHRPMFDKKGNVTKMATFTVIQNGILVQDHVELTGGTDWRGGHAVSDYAPHDDAGPIMLQDHGNPVRYRNIWVRELKD